MELRMRRPLLGIGAVIALVGSSTSILLADRIAAQDKPAPAAPAQSKEAQETKKSKDAKKGDVGDELVVALKSSPGCLGVETGQMNSGKVTIFAWFEDKKAVLDWYYGDAHQSAMGAMAA